jgi:TIR domain
MIDGRWTRHGRFKWKAQMTQSSYPRPVEHVVATLIEICQHQLQAELVELLSNSHSRFEEIGYDNWNGGTTTWALGLEIPTPMFASVQSRLAEVEKSLLQRLDFLDRVYPHDPIGEVTITPLSSAQMPLGQRMAASDVEVRHLWKDGCLRLFLSHIALYKVQASDLKDALAKRGISAFVAHEDIEPALEWPNEISLALRSMHALAALITPDFRRSNWTDQEVGWALGRGVPVMPVRLGADPNGFAAKIQAIPGSLDSLDSLADAVVQALLRHRQTRGQMRRALVKAFENSDSFATAKRLKQLVVAISDFTDEEKERLRKACTENDQVADSCGVVDAIYEAFGGPKAKPHDGDVPF